MINQILRVILGAKDEVTPEAQKAKKGLGGFADSALGVAKVVGAAFAGGLLAAFFKSTIDEAAEGERGMRRLGLAVDNAGGTFDRLRPSLEATVAAVMKVSTATDDDLRAALTTLITITGDTRKSQDLLALSADLAAKKQIGLEEAATLVGKATLGNTKGLKDLGITTTDAALAIEQLRAKVGGYAAIEANDFLGGLKRAWNQLGEVKEAIGNVILGNSDLGSSTGAVADMFGRLAAFIEENEGRFGLLVESVGAAASQLRDMAVLAWDTLGPALTFLAKIAIGGLVAGVNVLTYGFRMAQAVMLATAAQVADTIAAIIEKGGALLSLFGIKVGQETAASLRAWAEKTTTAVRASMAQASETLTTGMQKLWAARQDAQRKVAATDAAHESTLTGHATGGANDRVALTQKELDKIALARQKAHVETLQLLDRAAEAMRKKMADPTEDAVARARDLGKAMEAAFGNNTQALIGATSSQIDAILRAAKDHVPLKEWQQLVALADQYRNRLQVTKQQADSLQQAAKDAAEWNADYQRRQKEELDRIHEKHQRIVQDTAAIARGVLDGVHAMGLLSDESASVLNSVINIGANIAKAFAGDPAAIVSIIGSLANVISGIGTSAAEKKRLESAATMSHAIDKLAREVGNLALGATGRTVSGAEAAIEAAKKAYAESAAKGGKETAFRAAERAFDQTLLKMGVSKEEANALYKELFGKDIARANKQGFYEAILGLGDALAEVEFGQYAQDVNGQLQAVQDQIELLNISDADAKLALYKARLGGKSQLLDTIFNAADPTAALAQLQNIAVGLNSGAYKGQEALFGDFNGQQLLDLLKILKPLIEGADQLGGTLPSGVALVAAGGVGTVAVTSTAVTGGGTPAAASGAGAAAGAGTSDRIVFEGDLNLTVQVAATTTREAAEEIAREVDGILRRDYLLLVEGAG